MNGVALVTDGFDLTSCGVTDGGNFALQRVATLGALEERLADLSTRVVLYDAGLRIMSRPVILDHLEQHGVHLVLRIDLRRCPMLELAKLCARLPRAMVVLKSAPSQLSQLLFALLSGHECDPGPVAWTFGGIATHDDQVARILFGSLALGDHRATVDQLSTELGIGKRALQNRLQRVGLQPHRLLLWGQVFWAAWRMSVCNHSSKRAAADGGFSTSSSMAASLRSILDASPRTLAKPLAIQQLIEQLSGELDSSVMRAAHSLS